MVIFSHAVQHQASERKCQAREGDAGAGIGCGFQVRLGDGPLLYRCGCDVEVWRTCPGAPWWTRPFDQALMA